MSATPIGFTDAAELNSDTGHGLFAYAGSDSSWLSSSIPLYAKCPDTAKDRTEYERREQVCKDAALSQWERSLKRPDLDEKSRVIGAIDAFKRQAFAFTMFDALPHQRKHDV